MDSFAGIAGLARSRWASGFASRRRAICSADSSIYVLSLRLPDPSPAVTAAQLGAGLGAVAADEQGVVVFGLASPVAVPFAGRSLLHHWHRCRQSSRVALDAQHRIARSVRTIIAAAGHAMR